MYQLLHDRRLQSLTAGRDVSKALQCTELLQTAGAGEFLTLKEYKLMVEAGQLAPYKGSLPSADAKYAAGWAMKRFVPIYIHLPVYVGHAC